MNCHQRRCESFAQLTPEDQHTTTGASPIPRLRRKNADHARAVYDGHRQIGTVVERSVSMALTCSALVPREGP